MRQIRLEKLDYRGMAAVVMVLVLGSGAGLGATGETNWSHWRGPEDNGCAAGGQYPVSWDAEKVLWKAALPGKGCSTPIVWDGRIYVTAPVNRQNGVLAYDWDGKLVWERTLGVESEGKHRNGSGSNASVVTEGKGLYVYFKSGDLGALELDGRVRWQTNLVAGFGEERLFWDHGTSPVLTEKYVVMARLHHGDSWVAAFEKGTGAMAWKVSRNYETPTECDNSYGTPLVVRAGGREALLVWGAQRVTLHETGSGKLLWAFAGEFDQVAKQYWPTVASVVVTGEVAVVPFGRADRGQPRLYGIKVGENAEQIWKREDTGTFVPTPAVAGGRVYLLRDRGELQCLDAATGQTVWGGAFSRGSTSFYASPLVAGGKLYAAREDGVVFVAGVEGKFEVLGENRMGERVIASPVAVGNRLLIRGERHLFCVAL